MRNKIALVLVTLAINLIAQQTSPTIIKNALVIKTNVGDRRSVSQKDAIELSIVQSNFNSPVDSDELVLNDSTTSIWKEITADENGWFDSEELKGGYAFIKINSETERTLIMEGMSHSSVYVNGAPRMGNVYQYKDTYEDWEPDFNISLLPVRLTEGDNEFLFRCGYGRLKVQFHEPLAIAQFNEVDLTLPDIIVNEEFDSFGGIIVINNTTEKLSGYEIKTSGEYFEEVVTPVPVVQPIHTRKVQFCFRGTAPATKMDIPLNVCLINSSTKEIVYETTINLRVMEKEETYKETFISKIDGSVQYYAVNPSRGMNTSKPQALFLSLHGAAVEGWNQANAYYAKDWGIIVSPTNRRPYGFNWEDWGRTDALEVLDLANSRFNIDPDRVYLTGHSMGGHGTWQLGACFPDRFAAIGPSAGWISFWTYRFFDKTEITNPVLKLIKRSGKQSDTYALTKNYSQLGVYIIHGESDNNVPAKQSYDMIDTLKQFHKDFVYYEEPGAGHWWDKEETRGADCVDWMPLFDYFSRHSVPSKQRINHINFRTANPGISSQNNWVTIYGQEEFLKISVVDIKYLLGRNRFIGTSYNISILSLDLDITNEGEKLSINLDGMDVENINPAPEDSKIWLSKESGNWKVIEEPDLKNKGPHRYGTFKKAFDNNMVFVYGTAGNREENDWAFKKAKYDAEQFWYQGNGAVEIVSDSEYDSNKYADRNIILYGNSQTNTVWGLLLKNAPFRVEQDGITIDGKTLQGNDLTCLAVYPKEDSNTALIGVVSGTGIKGMRLSNHRPYLSAGFAFPDFTVIDPRILSGDDAGFRAAGFFGIDWSVKNGEFEFNE